jgi:hypothetical protein
MRDKVIGAEVIRESIAAAGSFPLIFIVIHLLQNATEILAPWCALSLIRRT